MRTARSVVAAALAAVLVCLPALAQPVEIPRLGETIEVSIVNVEVFVTDRKGNRIRGLTQNDFEIRENGRLQPITNFAEYAPEPRQAEGTIGVDAAPAAGPASSPSAAPPVKRTIVVFLEAFTLPPFGAKPFFAGLRDLLRRAVRPGDAAAIVSWSGGTLVRQEFTDDVEALESALTKIESESSGVQGNYASDLRRQEEFESAFRGMLAEDGRFTVTDGTTKHFNAIAAAKFELFKIKQKTDALNAFMHSMSGVEGKKIVVMATNRFGVYAGAEFFNGVVPPQFQGELDTRKYRESLTHTANANGITLYPIYPEGLRWTAMHDATQVRADISAISSDEDAKDFGYDNNVLMNETGSLHELAERTGGISDYGSKNLVALLPRIADDLETYYSLAYRATARGKDDVRKLVVTAKNPEHVVRSRRQFVEKSDAARMNDRVIANLFQVADGSLLPIEATVGEFEQKGKRRWSVPLSIRIPIRSLTMVDGPRGPAGGFTVYIASGGVFGVVSEVQQRTQPFTIDAKEIERARQSHFTYHFDLTVDHVTDRVSIGVLDEVSKEYGLYRLDLPERAAEGDPAGSR